MGSGREDAWKKRNFLSIQRNVVYDRRRRLSPTVVIIHFVDTVQALLFVVKPVMPRVLRQVIAYVSETPSLVTRHAETVRPDTLNSGTYTG